MTLNELLEIGDEVVFKVDPETRHWTNTYDNVPDGTKGVVCCIHDAIMYYGRTHVLVHAPGAYHTKGGAQPSFSPTVASFLATTASR